MNVIKNVMILEDLSSLSSISMNVALPIISSYGLRALAVPVKILTTQTETNTKNYQVNDLKWLKETLQMAVHLFPTNLNALVGYLGENTIIDLLLQSQVLPKCQLLLVDPVMGDNGHYYPLLDDSYMSKLKEILQYADIITPNLTELYFLIGEKYVACPSQEKLKHAVTKLRQQLKQNVTIIVTGIQHDDQIGCYWENNITTGEYYVQKIGKHFYGTGDAFAAMTLALLLKNHSLSKAVPHIMRSLKQVAKNTLLNQNALKLGIDITTILHKG